MKLIAKRNIFKTITLILVILIMINFAMPNFIYAIEEDSTTGGSLFDPLLQLACWLADLTLKTMQNIFLGIPNIKIDDPTGAIDNKSIYEIYYSPGKIFTGTVPGLDINFINPNSSMDVISKKEYQLLSSPNYEQIGITSTSEVFNKNTTWDYSEYEYPRGDPNDPRCN